MRKFFFLLALGLALGSSVVAQDIDKVSVVSVNGTAEVLVAPDQVVFTLVVAIVDKDLQIAKRLHDERMARILELTRRFGVAPQDVKTDFISVDMKYESIRDAKTRIYDDDGDEIGKRVFRGYEISKTVIVKLTDLSRFEEFFSEVLKAGVSVVKSVKFETSKLRENRDKARDMAMKAAREKATALAAAVGQTIGRAVKIVEGPGYQGYDNAQQNSNYASLSGNFSESVATFAPGAIKVEAIVTVTFLLN